MTDNLNQHIIEGILRIKEDGNLYHRESQNLEFKESFNLAGLADYYRDFAAFANNKGGYLIFGVKDRPKRELIGLSPKAYEQFDRLDPEMVSGHLNELFTSNIAWEHEIFESNGLKYGSFFIHEATLKPIICKKDEGKDQILKNGDIYFRYGGRTQKIQHGELEAIINKRIEQNNNQWLDLVQKIGRSGPQNAAILDTERGLIEKSENQILVVDEELVKNIQWIKEGEFSEKKGEKTLKLVGSVVPIDHVEVVKKVKENQLKEYPLSAQQLHDAVKSRIPTVKQHEVYKIISENEIKKNKEYSSYVFRNKKQADDYEEYGDLPRGIPSIYKQSTVDLIVRIYKNENDPHH